MNKNIPKLLDSGWTYSISVVAGIVITYAASIKTDLIEVTLYGAVWGLFVGSSLAAMFDSLRDLNNYKWNAIGWAIVALTYGYWVTFHYSGVEGMPVGEVIYWRVLAWALTAYLVSWLFIGSFLSVKFGKRTK